MASGVNDITILAGFVFIFVIASYVLPLVDPSINDNGVFGFLTDVQEAADNMNSLLGAIAAPFIFFFKVLSMATWTFSIPIFVEICFLTPIRILFYIVILRNLWIGGGA
jgi:hypothetical protein